MKITILGSGTWGTALANLLAKKGEDVTLVSALPKDASYLLAHHSHPHLPGILLEPSIHYGSIVAEATPNQDVVVFAAPSKYFRATAKKAAPYLSPKTILVSVSKGIEEGSLFTMSEILQDEDHALHPVVVLSGPSHAEEVAAGLPTCIVSSSHDDKAAKTIQHLFSTPYFRVYTNRDPHGVELCGAFKNILALASGISDGLGYGDNAKAALMTRGIAEMRRLGQKSGCQDETFFGLAGVGDVIVTATSKHSRNRLCGSYLGQGIPYEEAVQKVGMVVEGVLLLPALKELENRYEVELPIADFVYEVCFHRRDPRDGISVLLGRALKSECDNG